uniref:Conotoxin as25a n=1 Tax=Conus cancellatus TaxID=289020 RepID=CXPA_CONCF|nr:RecName: Full=Conotoxin as25a; AltName: Full=As25b [Conus cancellatus]
CKCPSCNFNDVTENCKCCIFRQP